MDTLEEPGGMLAVAANEASASELIDLHGKRVSIAALNSPQQTVLAGGLPELRAIREACAQRGIRAALLPVTHAFHSELMAPIVGAYDQVVKNVSFRGPPGLPFVSTLTGGRVGEELRDPQYWSRHMVAPVRFEQAIALAGSEAPGVFVEVGPGGALLAMGMRVLEQGTWLRSVRKGHERATFLSSVGRLHESGYDVRTARRNGRRIASALPAYPFERRVFWKTRARRGAGAANRTGEADGLLNFVAGLSDDDARVYLDAMHAQVHS